MQERIRRPDAPDETTGRPPEHARDHLRQRLDRLADAHPSSDHYREESRDATRRAGSGWDAPSARDYSDRPADGDIQLSADRDRHVLEGDGEGKPGGGHRYGTNKPGKTEFPETWSDEKIRQTVVDVSRNPDSVLRERTDRWLVTGDRDGVRVSAVVLTDGQIWTAWPHPGGAGVRQNPKAGAA